MKKCLVLMAMAGVALAGCVNDVADVAQSQEQKKVKIAFDTPVLYNSTESRDVTGEMPSIYKTGETFTVYGIEHVGDFQTWTIGGTTSWLMNGTVVSYDSDLNGWKPAADVMWPYGKKCTFAAYSPSRAKDDGTINYGSGGLTIENFIVRSDIGDQYDLMYTPREYNRTTSSHTTGTYNGVPLTFKHALSSIHFALVSSYPLPVTLQSIKLAGLYNKAKFEEKVEELATYSAAPAWSEFEGSASYTIYEGTGITFPSDMQRLSALLPVGSDHHGLLTIPQDLTNAKLLVSYTIQGEDPVVDQEVSLSSYFSNKWEMGTRYYYVLSIGAASSKIYFAPIVEAWNTDDTIIQLK